MYAVLEFSDGVFIAPNSWLFNDSKKCYWPKCKDVKRLDKLISSKAAPGKKWRSYEVLRVFSKTDNFEQAKRMLEHSLKLSSMESGMSKGKDISTAKKRKFEDLKFLDEDPVNAKMPTTLIEPSTKNRRILQSNCSEGAGMQIKEPALCVPSIKNSKDREETESDSSAMKRLTLSKVPALSIPTVSLSEISELVNIADDAQNADAQNGSGECLPDIEFQKKVLQKLDEIIAMQVEIRERLDSLEVKQDETDSIQRIFDELPLKSMKDFQEFEERLKGKNEMENVVKALSAVGGADPQSMIVNIFKKFISDDLAEKFTWRGSTGKLSFKDCLLPKCIFRSIRFTFQTFTEDQLKFFSAHYFKYAKQRLMRKQLKVPIKIENIASEDD